MGYSSRFFFSPSSLGFFVGSRVRRQVERQRWRVTGGGGGLLALRFICSSRGLLPVLPHASPLSSISFGRTASSAAAATNASRVERSGGRGGEHRRRSIKRETKREEEM